MQRWKIITPFALVSVVAVAYFSAGPRVPMDNDNTSALAISEKASENALDKKEGGFGADVDLGDGIILNVTDPAAFKSASSGIAKCPPAKPLITTVRSGSIAWIALVTERITFW